VNTPQNTKKKRKTRCSKKKKEKPTEKPAGTARYAHERKNEHTPAGETARGLGATRVSKQGMRKQGKRGDQLRWRACVRFVFSARSSAADACGCGMAAQFQVVCVFKCTPVSKELARSLQKKAAWFFVELGRDAAQKEDRRGVCVCGGGFGAQGNVARVCALPWAERVVSFFVCACAVRLCVLLWMYGMC